MERLLIVCITITTTRHIALDRPFCMSNSETAVQGFMRVRAVPVSWIAGTKPRRTSGGRATGACVHLRPRVAKRRTIVERPILANIWYKSRKVIPYPKESSTTFWTGTEKKDFFCRRVVSSTSTSLLERFQGTTHFRLQHAPSLHTLTQDTGLRTPTVQAPVYLER